MKLLYENLDIEEAASEFHLHGRHLLQQSNFGELRELYAEYATQAQWQNQKDMPAARGRLQLALTELFESVRPRFNRQKFAHIGTGRRFINPEGPDE